MNLSVSQIQLYLECPHKYWLRYFNDIPEPEKSEALIKGIEFHASIKKGFSEEHGINEMIKVLVENNIYKDLCYFPLEHEKKQYCTINGLDFVYICDAVNKDIIFEFKTAKELWSEDKFETELQPHLYMEAERINTGVRKRFFYFIVTKDKQPEIQIKEIKFNQDLLNKIITTGNQILRDFEFLPEQYKDKKNNCWFCDYKDYCRVWF